MQEFKGTGVALITPFDTQGMVDVLALERIVEHVISGGVEYIVVLGTTAETATLTPKEKQLIKQTIVRANKNRLPLVLGVGGNNTQQVVEQLQSEDFTGFSAVLSVAPYYNKPTQEGIYQHFKTIALKSVLPIIIYNVPGRTSCNILPQTTLRLAKDFKNIIGIKEASGDIVQVMEIIKSKPEDFLVISGDDITALPSVLAGGAGVISVIGEAFPKTFSQMIRLGLQREVNQAYDLHYALTDITNMIYEQGNPAGVKAVFKVLGICENSLRLPLVSVDENLAKRIENEVKNSNNQ